LRVLMVHVLHYDGEWERYPDMFKTPPARRKPSRGAHEGISCDQGPCRGLWGDDYDSGGCLHENGGNNDKEGEVESPSGQ